MVKKPVTSLFIEIFAVVAIIGLLAAIVLPNIGDMVDKGNAKARAEELRNIQAAVTQMLKESVTGELAPAGPTADINRVTTTDTPPLELRSYLKLQGISRLSSGCTYIFYAVGTVTQIIP